MGRGYSFEALRAKILFTEGIHSRKQARPKFERKRAPEPTSPPPKNYGADISTLIRMIEAGEL